MATTPNKDQVCYKFDRYLFYPGDRRLVQDGSKQLWLDPKPSALLQALIRNPGKLITYEELKRQVPELQRLADRTLHQHKYALSALLGKNSEGEDYIENISGKGYRFIIEVSEHCQENLEGGLPEARTKDDDQESTDIFKPPKPFELTSSVASSSASELTKVFGGHTAHVMVSSSLYSLLYSEALLVEVAYQYDRYASSVWMIAIAIFFLVMGTSVGGLWADWLWTVRGKKTGLLLSLPISIVCALSLYIALGFYLPNEPITEARFQTYPAHGAYLKSIYYFLPLAAVFLILPYHFVISLQREIGRGNRLVKNLLLGKRRAAAPSGSLFLRPWMLGPLLFGAAIYALLATGHLFDNLYANKYTNLFIQLVQLRLLLYFALGLECLFWYSTTVNKMKEEVLHMR